MPITALPVPQTRSDPVNFNSRADVFLSTLPTFADEANTLQAGVNASVLVSGSALGLTEEQLDNPFLLSSTL